MRFGYVRSGKNVGCGAGGGVLNQTMSKGFGPLGEEATGDWRKLPNEALQNLHSSPDINGMIKSNRTQMGGACSTFQKNKHVQIFHKNT